MPLLKRPLFGKKTRKSLEGPSTEGGGAAAEAEAVEEQSGGMPPPTAELAASYFPPGFRFVCSQQIDRTRVRGTLTSTLPLLT